MSRHDDVAKSGAMSLEEMAVCTSKVSGENKFAGTGMVMGDIKGLLPESDEEEPKEREREEEEDDGEGDGKSTTTPRKRGSEAEPADVCQGHGPGAPRGCVQRRPEEGDGGGDDPRPKKQKLLCIDDAIASGLRNFRTWYTSLTDSCQNQYTDAQQVLKDAVDPLIATQVANEVASCFQKMYIRNLWFCILLSFWFLCHVKVAILKTRVYTLELVFNGPAAKLKKHIQNITQNQAAPAAGCSTMAGRARLGMAPPCKSYAELVLVSTFQPYEEKIKVAASKEAILQLLKDLCGEVSESAEGW